MEKAVKKSTSPISSIEGADFSGCMWGEKSSEESNKSMFYEGEWYSLYDCVYCNSGLILDHIGKIMRLYEDKGVKKCRVRWFFRPSELPPKISGVMYEKGSKQVFLGLGNIRGVENENQVEVIVRKCKVLCTEKNANNPQPSQADLESADHYFNTAYDAVKRKLVKIEKIAGFLAEKIYNKEEWVTGGDSAMLEKEVSTKAGRSISGDMKGEGTEVVPSMKKITSSRSVNNLSRDSSDKLSYWKAVQSGESFTVPLVPDFKFPMDGPITQTKDAMTDLALTTKARKEQAYSLPSVAHPRPRNGTNQSRVPPTGLGSLGKVQREGTPVSHLVARHTSANGLSNCNKDNDAGLSRSGTNKLKKNAPYITSASKKCRKEEFCASPFELNSTSTLYGATNLSQLPKNG